MLSNLQMFLRFSAGLRCFLSQPLSPSQCASLIRESIENREANFLSLMRRAVYDVPGSPWLALLNHARVENGDLARLVRESGIEAALCRLRDAGVVVSLDEFKGHVPIVRPGLELPPRDDAFDNPLLLRDFTVLSGGTSGRRRRLAVDLDLLVFEAATQYLFLDAHGLLQRPLALWRPVPPGSSAIKHVLRSAKLGLPVAAWFHLGEASERQPWQSRLFLRTAIARGRRHGNCIPTPIPVPPANPEPVVRWLAGAAAQATPAVLSSPASAAVRVARYAVQKGIPITGTVFWMGGEPITAAKVEAIREAGCTTVNGWSLSETGPLALGCANREALDEVHFIHSKVAAIPSDSALNAEAAPILLTTLLPATPKILLNVNIGDTAVLSNRRCCCPIENSGFPHHAYSIRAESKLTAGGMQFLRSDLEKLTESVLPSIFGGGPNDYQFVEEEHRGQPRVLLLVNPAVGPIDEDSAASAVLHHLGGRSRGNAMMVNTWKASGILRVHRGIPRSTAAGKTPPLWVSPRE